MARGKTFKFGKTLINISSRGIATKDTSTGEIKRHAFPWTQAPHPAQPEPEQPEYAEDEDEQQFYREEGPAYYGGGYQGYDDEGAYDDEEDAYAGEEEEYEEEEEQARPAGLLGSTWFMWLMLIVLPPLGIWLLWRHNRYEITPRSAISAAAVVWFIILLIWLFSHIGGRDNTVLNMPTASPSPSPTVEAEASPTPEPSADAQATDNVGDNIVNANPAATNVISATDETAVNPTPNTEGTAVSTATDAPTDTVPTSDPTQANPASATFVYSTTDGTYYHSYATCSNMTNAQRVTLSVALTRKQTACPYCWAQASGTPKPTSTPLPAGMYYYRPDGTYYHLDPNCTGMKNAQLVSEAEAIAAGKISCPTCIGSVYMNDGGQWYHSNSTCQGMKNARKVTITEAKNAGKTECPVCMNGTNTTGTGTATGDTSFYATDGGKWYHSNSTCQGMTGAYRISAAAAEQAGKTACPVCLSGNSGTASYYATSGGTWYHTDRNCQGMTNASRVTLATAIARGQTACPKCAGGKETTATNTTNTSNVVKVDTGNTTPTTNTKVSDSTYYSTTDGTYFHKDPTCTGMKNATTVSAAEIARRGQTPCPKCIGTSGIYYSTETGTYYHSNPTCTGMTGANIVTLAMIRSRNQTACPRCIGGGATTTGTDGGEPNGTYYATPGGTYYHKNATCTGMKNAVKITRATAESRGQTPCPTCIGSVYSAGGQYYHKDPTCQGMKNAELVTIQAAEKAGQTACPVCIGGGTTNPGDNGSGDSNLIYYATETGAHYHRNATCSGMSGATKVSEATAKARGQTPCPVCIGTVYATENGDYYHSDPTCTGMKGARLMTVDQAELSGKAPCPTCMGGTPIEKIGDSVSNSTGGETVQTASAASNGSTQVWITIEGAKYHTSSKCSELTGKVPASTRLDWAVKNGYGPCSVCGAPTLDRT